MTPQDTLETWLQEAAREGARRGVVRGVACSLIDVYEALFGALPQDVHAVIEATHDGPTLRAWVKLASVRGSDEVAAAIRASRTSSPRSG